MGMGMTALALQQMHLVSARHCLCAATAHTVSTCTKFLKRLPGTRGSPAPSDVNTLYTWRPEPVLDLFLLLSRDPAREIIGISMYDDEGACAAVEYFKPGQCMSEDVSVDGDVVLLGQMTLDSTPSENSYRPMLLVYDAFDPDAPCRSAADRYATVQRLSTSINSMRIGAVQCVVQWAGELAYCDQISHMHLPHSTDGLLCIKPHLGHSLCASAH